MNGRRRPASGQCRGPARPPTCIASQDWKTTNPVLFRAPAAGWPMSAFSILRPLKRSAGLEVDDLAKRLMITVFHAPTVSCRWPATVMVWPDRKRVARGDRAVLRGDWSPGHSPRRGGPPLNRRFPIPATNPLRRAHPHASLPYADQWDRPTAAAGGLPAAFAQRHKNKFWPAWPGSITPTAIATWSAPCPRWRRWRSASELSSSHFFSRKGRAASPPYAGRLERGLHPRQKAGQPRAVVFSHASPASSQPPGS